MSHSIAGTLVLGVKGVTTWLCSLVAGAGLALAGQPQFPPPSIHLETGAMAWEPASEIPGFPTGRLRKLLHLDSESGAGAAIIKHPAGFIEPRHYHTTGAHSIYVLEGRMKFGGIPAGAGHFFFTPAWEAHGPIEILEETIFLIWSDGPLDVNLGTPEEQSEMD